TNPIAISRDGKLYAWTTGDSVTVSNIASQDQVTSFGENAIKASSLTFNGAGTILAAGMENGEVRLFDLAAKSFTGGEVRHLIGHTDAFTAAAFSRDDVLLASAGADKPLRIWDAASGGAIAPLNISSASISSLVFTADGINL